MATGEGPRADDLTLFDRFRRDPKSFHIFLALRVLEARHAEAPRLGVSRRPAQDGVRLGQQPTLAFPPTTIEAYRPPADGRPGRLVNLFFGLFGPHGPLPSHLTEYARERQRTHRDETLVAFADMLTHRSMSLLYRAWATGQPAPDLDRSEGGRIEQHVAALAGYRGANLRGRDAMPDLARRHFAGHLGRRSKNPEGLAAILSAFFGAGVRLQEFVGSWLRLEPGDLWRLGGTGGLGGDAILGRAVWSRDAKFRIRIGPLDLGGYRALLPGGAALERLAAIVRSYCGDALDWDVNLVLAGDEVPRAALGGDASLGRTSWLGERRGGGDAADLLLARADIITDNSSWPDRPAEEALS